MLLFSLGEASFSSCRRLFDGVRPHLDALPFKTAQICIQERPSATSMDAAETLTAKKKAGKSSLPRLLSIRTGPHIIFLRTDLPICLDKSSPSSHLRPVLPLSPSPQLHPSVALTAFAAISSPAARLVGYRIISWAPRSLTQASLSPPSPQLQDS